MEPGGPAVYRYQYELKTAGPPRVPEILEAIMQDTLEAVLASKGSTVYSVAPETPVLDAVRTMNRARVGALLVCVANELVGIFTERDVLNRVVDPGRDPTSTKVVEVMTSEVVTVRSNTGIQDAMAVISERRFRHLPVIDDGKLLGVVSSGDLTRWVSRNQEGHIQDLVNYITGKYPG
jgi:CBS domain-containing protein